MPTPIESIAGVTNACQAAPNLITGGQPAAAHLKAFKDAGGSVVLDIRDPMEARPFDEPALARELGLEYVNVAVVAGALDDRKLEQILAVLRGAEDRPIFFHCASGNRVGGALIPFFILDHAMEEEDATTMAMRVGLRSAELLEWGLDYSRRHDPRA
jgi:protein tyrosine phosphatase (PTP) superfamily phosphohydrolase (DUF442 family)